MDYREKYTKYQNRMGNTISSPLSSESKLSSRGGGVSSFVKGDVNVSVATLNQWSTDYEGNERRIMEAISMVIDGVLLLPELATCGYSCQDHFLEREVHELSFNIIKNILRKPELTKNILLAIGCPIIHNDIRYNTTMFINDGKLILVRPKINLADDGNYREARWFTSWPREKYETFHFNLDGVRNECPIGIGIINCNDVLIAAEICEELWVPHSINSELYLSGVDIIVNGSGSHFETGKLQKRIDLVKNATKKSGGVYLYSNMEGGDGDRLWFDGRSFIGINGQILNMEDAFTLREVQVLTERVHIPDILSYRMRNNSFGFQGAIQRPFPVISVKLNLVIPGSEKYDLKDAVPSAPPRSSIPPSSKLREFGFGGGMGGGSKWKEDHSGKFVITDEDMIEIINAASSWLWDYLRRSGAQGFMLPLSGGADSASTATIIYNMCTLIDRANRSGPNKPITDFINKFYIHNDGTKDAVTPESLCKRILNTVYLPTKFSGQDDRRGPQPPVAGMTRQQLEAAAAIMPTGYLAAKLSERIGATHRVIDIQGMFEAGITGVAKYTGHGFQSMKNEVTQWRDGKAIDPTTGEPFKWPSGALKRSPYDLLFQNVQARLRMINTYLLAQTVPTMMNPETPTDYKNSTFLLVLGSSNADEILVGYYTKYDASAADVNPIGSLSKTYINRLLEVMGRQIHPLQFIRAATPTAELIETTSATKQTDETDMGITYQQIFELGKLRASGYGPIDTYLKIKDTPYLNEICSVDPFGRAINPKRVVEIFFDRYNINRNKTTIIPPSVHLVPSPDDNRYDLRPFLYPSFLYGKQNSVIQRMQ